MGIPFNNFLALGKKSEIVLVWGLMILFIIAIMFGDIFFSKLQFFSHDAKG